MGDLALQGFNEDMGGDSMPDKARDEGCRKGDLLSNLLKCDRSVQGYGLRNFEVVDCSERRDISELLRI